MLQDWITYFGGEQHPSIIVLEVEGCCSAQHIDGSQVYSFVCCRYALLNVI
jgi:hypothetical protein